MNSSLKPLENRAVADQAASIASTASGWFIVSQVKSNRIVYFTDDPHYHPPSEGDWYFVTHYLGDLPDGITLATCWGWRFSGGTFTDAREAVAPEPHEALLESNRRALLTLLRQKVDKAREPWAPTCSLGDVLRKHKLEEAQRYRATTPDAAATGQEDDFALLRSVATAKRITVAEAAELILRFDREMLQSLSHSEQVREHYTGAIREAKTQEELIQLRSDLLSERWHEPVKVAPVSPPMNPADWHATLGAVARANEITLLQCLLRQIINERRTLVLGHYAGDQLLTQHKMALANQILNGDTRGRSEDFRLIESYAVARKLSLKDAARLMLGTAEEAQQVLIGTELRKDQLLAQIEGIKTLWDVRQITLELDALAKTMRRADSNAT